MATATSERTDPDPKTEAYKNDVEVGQKVRLCLLNGTAVEGIYRGHDTADSGAFRLIETAQFPGCLLEVPQELIMDSDVKKYWPSLLQ